MIAREHEEIKAIERYTPIIEMYIQEVKPDAQLGIMPKTDYYFLGQADFRKRLKVQSSIAHGRKSSLMWSFDTAGFLQMIYLDRDEFARAHYKFKYVRQEFSGEVRCYVFDVVRPEKARGARFAGRIWVEDQAFTIVHFNGNYSPAVRFSFRSLEDEYYLHFDSWRVNVKPGLWLPAYIYNQELGCPMSFSGPRYKSQTRLWGYNLSSGGRQEELNQLLVESPGAIKDEAAQQDRSPLEAQRDGFLAPPGDVDKLLDTIVNNLLVTNNLSGQIELHCRVLLTSSLELFSIQNTIVISRGLIDVVPDEATLATILAQEVADAMVPKSYQDQYGFSDVLRLSSTEILKRLCFQNEKKKRKQQPRCYRTVEEIALRRKHEKRRAIPRATAFASEGSETIDQPAAWQSGILRGAIDASRAPAVAGEQGPDCRATDGSQRETRSLQRSGYLDEERRHHTQLSPREKRSLRWCPT